MSYLFNNPTVYILQEGVSTSSYSADRVSGRNCLLFFVVVHFVLFFFGLFVFSIGITYTKLNKTAKAYSSALTIFCVVGGKLEY